jgi:hypothetical protein
MRGNAQMQIVRICAFAVLPELHRTAAQSGGSVCACTRSRVRGL